MIAAPEGGNQDSALYQVVPRVTTYANYHQKYRKEYSPGLFPEINRIARQGLLAEILNIGDFEDQSETFSLSQPTTVLVVAMGEGVGEMDDFGGIRQKKHFIWRMDFDKSYHAGGAIKNRVQMELLSLQPGDYRLTYRSGDLHSPRGWNDAPPANPGT